MSLVYVEKCKTVINQAIPAQLIRKKKGGYDREKKQEIWLDYVSGATVIDLLNSAFNYMWSYETTREWMQDSVPKKKYNSDEVEPQAPVAHVCGKLTVYLPLADGTGYFPIVKTAYGSQVLNGGASEQESCFKSAGTDALKKAAQQVGIAQELYRNEDEQAYFEVMNYEDPWTPEARETFKNDLHFIGSLIGSDVGQYTEEQMDEFVQAFDNRLASLSDIVPENIAAFREWLESGLKAAS